MSDEMVCAKCGGSRIDADFTLSGRGSCTVAVDEKGRPYAEDVDTLGAGHVEYDGYRCADCDARSSTLMGFVVPKHRVGIELVPGSRVTLPDGYGATIEAVDEHDETFTVVGWHETFKAGEARLAA